ncbi:DUF4097 family beta strand repeat-containing protein [candidate division KSB1 bacterium]
MKNAAIFTVLFILLIPLYAVSESPSSEVRDKEVKSFDMKPGGQLIVESNDGFIRVKSWNEDRVEVTMLKRAWAKDKRDAERLLEIIEIDIDHRGNKLYIRDVTDNNRDRNVGLLDLIRGDWDEGTTVDFEIMVPEEMNLDFTADDGDMRIANVRGEFSFNLDDGDLTIEDCRSDRIEAELDDGDIEIDNMEPLSGAGTGLIFIAVDDGNVFLRRTKINAVDIEGEDGEIVFRDVELKDLDVNLDDGDFEADMNIRESGKVRINLDDGDVDIDLPEELSAYFNLYAYDGRIRTNFPVEIERDDNRSWVRERIGNGDTNIRIEVDNGYIVINHR